MLAAREAEEESASENLRAIYCAMSPARKRDLYLLLGLMFVGAVAELLTIGAVAPFLALISDPDSARSMPLLRQFIETLGLSTESDLAAIATLVLIGIALVAGGIRLLLNWVSFTFVYRVGHELATTIYRRMLRQPYALFVRRNSSELLAGIEKVEAVAVGVLLPLLLTVTSTVIAIFIIAILLFIDPFVAALAAVLTSTIYLLVAAFARSRLRRNSAIVATHRIARMKQSQEGLGGLREILLDRSQPVFEQKFKEIDQEFTECQAANAFIGAAPRFVVEAAGMVLIAAVAYFVSLRPGGIVGAIPALGALALGAQRLLPLLQQAYAGWSSFMSHSFNLRDVVALLHAPISPAAEQPAPAKVEPLKNEIAFRSVSFRYPGGDQALKDIDLLIRQGERIGFVGRTGSGKSTLLDLLMGLLDPTAGRIEIDGELLGDSSRANWQAQIAHVPQAIYLSDSSIAENIAFGEHPDSIDRERVVAAAREAQIESFVRQLPEGFDTMIGERGVRLSGGQRQRIGIARALYKRARVLIFDEATSALDDETEAAVMETIDGLGRELTVLMIAHRLSTVANCDRVIRLEAGRITADGPPNTVTGTAFVERRS